MPPSGLTVLAWVWVGLALISAALILYDIFVRGYRQRMPIMVVVRSVTALYFGFLGVFGYARRSRSGSCST